MAISLEVLYLQAGTRVSLFFSFSGANWQTALAESHHFLRHPCLQGRVEEAFKDWSSKPIGSASIGQVQLWGLMCHSCCSNLYCVDLVYSKAAKVYQARLRSTGEDVAIKATVTESFAPKLWKICHAVAGADARSGTALSGGHPHAEDFYQHLGHGHFCFNQGSGGSLCVRESHPGTCPPVPEAWKIWKRHEARYCSQFLFQFHSNLLIMLILRFVQPTCCPVPIERGSSTLVPRTCFSLGGWPYQRAGHWASCF